PTNTLDPTMRDELLDQLAAAGKRGQAVLFSSHVLAEVERVCDRVGILQNGRLVHLQKLAEVRAIKRVQILFSQTPPTSDELPGMRAVRRENHHWTFDFAGELKDLLGW